MPAGHEGAGAAVATGVGVGAAVVVGVGVGAAVAVAVGVAVVAVGAAVVVAVAAAVSPPVFAFLRGSHPNDMRRPRPSVPNEITIERMSRSSHRQERGRA